MDGQLGMCVFACPFPQLDEGVKKRREQERQERERLRERKRERERERERHLFEDWFVCHYVIQTLWCGGDDDVET